MTGEGRGGGSVLFLFMTIIFNFFLFFEDFI